MKKNLKNKNLFISKSMLSKKDLVFLLDEDLFIVLLKKLKKKRQRHLEEGKYRRYESPRNFQTPKSFKIRNERVVLTPRTTLVAEAGQSSQNSLSQSYLSQSISKSLETLPPLTPHASPDISGMVKKTNPSELKLSSLSPSFQQDVDSLPISSESIAQLPILFKNDVSPSKINLPTPSKINLPTPSKINLPTPSKINLPPLSPSLSSSTISSSGSESLSSITFPSTPSKINLPSLSPKVGSSLAPLTSLNIPVKTAPLSPIQTKSVKLPPISKLTMQNKK